MPSPSNAESPVLLAEVPRGPRRGRLETLDSWNEKLHYYSGLYLASDSAEWLGFHDHASHLRCGKKRWRRPRSQLGAQQDLVLHHGLRRRRSYRYGPQQLLHVASPQKAASLGMTCCGTGVCVLRLLPGWSELSVPVALRLARVVQARRDLWWVFKLQATITTLVGQVSPSGILRPDIPRHGSRKPHRTPSALQEQWPVFSPSCLSPGIR